MTVEAVEAKLEVGLLRIKVPKIRHVGLEGVRGINLLHFRDLGRKVVFCSSFECGP
jgi:hypothetical protein